MLDLVPSLGPSASVSFWISAQPPGRQVSAEFLQQVGKVERCAAAAMVAGAGSADALAPAEELTGDEAGVVPSASVVAAV